METDLIQGRKDKKITQSIFNSLNKELESLKVELKKTEQEISDLSEEKVWLDQLEKYGNFLETKITDKKENQKEWLSGLVENIVIHSVLGEDRNGEQKQIGHKCEMIFKLRVVKDKFKWIDNINKKFGYEISEGRKKLTNETVNLQMGRGKTSLKKRLQRWGQL